MALAARLTSYAMQMMGPLTENKHGCHVWASLRLALVDVSLIAHGGVSWQERVWRGDAGGSAVLREKHSLCRPLEGIAFRLDLGTAEAGFEVVVDQAHGLHEGVASGGADEVEAALAQVF